MLKDTIIPMIQEHYITDDSMSRYVSQWTERRAIWLNADDRFSHLIDLRETKRFYEMKRQEKILKTVGSEKMPRQLDIKKFALFCRRKRYICFSLTERKRNFSGVNIYLFIFCVLRNFIETALSAVKNWKLRVFPIGEENSLCFF